MILSVIYLIKRKLSGGVLMAINVYGKFAKELGVTPEHVRTMHRTGEGYPQLVTQKRN